MGAEMSTCQNGHVCECCLKNSRLRSSASRLTLGAVLSALIARPDFAMIANKLRLNDVAFSDPPTWHLRSSTLRSSANTMQSTESYTGSSMAGKTTATKLEELLKEVAQAGLCDASFGFDETAECSSAVVGCGWLTESAFVAGIQDGQWKGMIEQLGEPCSPLSNCWPFSEHNSGGYAAALCGGGEELSSLFGGLLSAEETAWPVSDELDSLCNSELMLLQDWEASGALQTQHVPATQLQEASAEVDTGCMRETSSPHATTGSVAITDEGEEFLADLDRLLSSQMDASSGPSATGEGSAANPDDATSSTSFWQSVTDDTSSVDASTLESDRFASPSSSAQPAQAPATGRRRGRKRCVSPSTRRERKRQQNREAAQRYRNRKHGEADTMDVQLERQQQRNDKLRVELRRAQTERNILLGFAKNFDLRGLIREQLSDSATSKARLATSLAALDKLVGSKSSPTSTPSKLSLPAQRAASTKIVTIVRPASIVTSVADSALRKRREPCPNKVASKLLRC